MDILGADGAAALAAAAAEPDPDSLGAGERLRRRFPADLAAAALTQVMLRRRARSKLGPVADRLLLTSAGLEQATRHQVADWRAGRFAAAGVTEVWDLGCGIGADALAFQRHGLRAQGVELDPQTAAFATANLALLGGPPVIVGAAEAVSVPPSAGVFLDPARRTSAGRTWRVADFTPPWSLVTDYLAGPRFCCVKLGPGLPKELIPGGVQSTFVSQGGDVVEASLWNGLPPGAVAVVFPRGGGEPIELTARERAPELPVGPIGRFIIEPDNAIIRAGLLAESVAGHDAWLLDPRVAYLSSDEPVDSPLVDCFEVTDVLDLDVATLRRHVRLHRIGRLEIKKRSVDVDPAELRRKLRPSGPGEATILLVRTTLGARAVVARRWPRGLATAGGA